MKRIQIYVCHEFIRCMPSHKDANFYLNIEKFLYCVPDLFVQLEVLKTDVHQYSISIVIGQIMYRTNMGLEAKAFHEI